MAVSLILATVGRTVEVGRLIESLLMQTDRRFDLIVADQNSDDRLVPYVERARNGGLEVRHERMPQPGLSVARNRGIALARHGILAFPDDDCWYEPAVIERVIGAFQSLPVGGLVGLWVEQAGTEPEKTYQLDLQAWRNFRGGNASSITLFLDRALFQDLGGFDERLGVGKWYGSAEETDFILRALGNGARLEHVPGIKVHHAYFKHPVGNWTNICRQARARSRGTGALYAKHGLALLVILRGLLAPTLKAVPNLLQPSWLLRGFFTSLGRLEGWLRWRKTES